MKEWISEVIVDVTGSPSPQSSDSELEASDSSTFAGYSKLFKLVLKTHLFHQIHKLEEDLLLAKKSIPISQWNF